jgi:hypothetical protein
MQLFSALLRGGTLKLVLTAGEGAVATNCCTGDGGAISTLLGALDFTLLAEEAVGAVKVDAELMGPTLALRKEFFSCTLLLRSSTTEVDKEARALLPRRGSSRFPEEAERLADMSSTLSSMLEAGVSPPRLWRRLLLPEERLLPTLLAGDGVAAAWDGALGERALALLRRELLCATISATSSSSASVYIFRKSPSGAIEALVISLSASLSLLTERSAMQ